MRLARQLHAATTLDQAHSIQVACARFLSSLLHLPTKQVSKPVSAAWVWHDSSLDVIEAIVNCAATAVCIMQWQGMPAGVSLVLLLGCIRNHIWSASLLVQT